MTMARICGFAGLIFVAAFLAGSLVSWMIEGVPYYRESAVSGAIVAGLMALQLHKNSKSETNG
jgi:hypothetical protein